jgi:hypothetical protein
MRAWPFVIYQQQPLAQHHPKHRPSILAVKIRRLSGDEIQRQAALAASPKSGGDILIINSRNWSKSSSSLSRSIRSWRPGTESIE